MQSPLQAFDPIHPFPGKSRGAPSIPGPNISTNWGNWGSEGSRGRAYPSPPMSDTPSHPIRRSKGYDDGGFEQDGRDIPQAMFRPQGGINEPMMAPPMLPFQQDSQLHSPFHYQRRPDLPVRQSIYQQQQQQQQQQRQQQSQQQQQQLSYGIQQTTQYAVTERPESAGSTSYSSPKSQRKTKGHVASACVPCKRAHLRCDAQRPCSRCLSTGKEDMCVDVQHKKRGRPRLRDERETRYESMGSTFVPATGHSDGRRPVSMYSPSDPTLQTSLPNMQRHNSYRVLKSQGEPHSMPRHQLEPGSYAGQSQATPLGAESLDLPCAYLTMDLRVAKTSWHFGEAVGSQIVSGKSLLDLITFSDQEKVQRLQRALEEERREREPNYLPPLSLYGGNDEQRVIQSVALGADEIKRGGIDRYQETLTFQTQDGQHRTYQVKLGLAKKDSTYFVALLLSTTHQQLYQRSTQPPYAQQYSYQTNPQAHSESQGDPTYFQYQSNQFSDPRNDSFSQPQPVISGNSQAAFARPNYTAPQRHSGQARHTDVSPSQTRNTSELQLPPIRSQQGMSQPAQTRGGRLDIGGLLEEPESKRRML